MSRTKGKVIVIQGGQWGSEAKGLITAKVCKDRNADICVRTGTVNAGHTVYHKGKQYKMQQLPVGWTSDAMLVLGAGAYIHPDILMRELIWLYEAGWKGAVLVDYNCGLHLPKHTQLSEMSGRHHKMGATGKGCSEAVMDKIGLRGTGNPLFSDWFAAANWPSHLREMVAFVDTSVYLNGSYDQGKTIVVEGTQGTLLDLHLGPYPYTTHKQTQAANWLAECGLSCTIPVELISVMRTYPIRVAGNSGPMPGEISWSHFAREMNYLMDKDLVAPWAITEWDNEVQRVLEEAKRHEPELMIQDPAWWSPVMRFRFPALASECHARAWNRLSSGTREELSKLFERTTVTNKLRRIAAWDPATAATSVMLNRPTSVALTFLNYVFPEAWGITRTTFGQLPQLLRVRILEYCADKALELGCPLSYVGFGPDEESTFCFYPDEVA